MSVRCFYLNTNTWKRVREWEHLINKDVKTYVHQLLNNYFIYLYRPYSMLLVWRILIWYKDSLSETCNVLACSASPLHFDKLQQLYLGSHCRPYPLRHWLNCQRRLYQEWLIYQPASAKFQKYYKKYCVLTNFVCTCMFSSSIQFRYRSICISQSVPLKVEMRSYFNCSSRFIPLIMGDIINRYDTYMLNSSFLQLWLNWGVNQSEPELQLPPLFLVAQYLLCMVTISMESSTGSMLLAVKSGSSCLQCFKWCQSEKISCV